MKNDDEIIESLILGGLIGATLGALISKDKVEGSTLGALAGAVILATYKANEKSKLTKIPMYFVENGRLYQTQTDGSNVFVRTIKKPTVKLPETFTLK
jgi:Glycine zipper 2TM domain